MPDIICAKNDGPAESGLETLPIYKSRVADSGEFYPDPDLTFEKNWILIHPSKKTGTGSYIFFSYDIKVNN